MYLRPFLKPHGEDRVASFPAEWAHVSGATERVAIERHSVVYMRERFYYFAEGIEPVRSPWKRISTMERFGLDTPFGIALLGGIIPPVVGFFWLLAAATLRHHLTASTLRLDEWRWTLLWLVPYGLMMAIVSYLSILIWYLAGAFLPLPLEPLAFVTWLICALFLFRRFFHR